MAEQEIERFPVWGSRIIGGIGLAVVVLVLVLGVVGDGAPYHPVGYPICGLVALMFWTGLIRPAVAVEGDRLVLRNPLTTDRVPLAAIEQVVVRQYLVVRVADRRLACSGIGRSRRRALRDDQLGDATGRELADLSYGGIVEHRLQRLAEEARTREHVELYSDEQAALAADVRREPARIELGLLAVLVVATVVALLV